LTLPNFADLAAAEAICALEALGWTRIAAGDWSWVLASADESQAARLSPWGDAYLLHARRCEAVQISFLPRVDAILPLGALGHVIVMERLLPAPESRAAAFCSALAVASDSGWQAPAGCDTSEFDGDSEIAILRDHLLRLAEEGEATLPFWGGLDVRPDNVMADARGRLKLVDPVFVSGPKIIAALEARDQKALAQLPAGAIAAFFSIPAFEAGPGSLAAAAIEMGLI
jgi:hypothetical protein